MKHHHTKGILKNSSFNSKMEFLKYDEKNWEDIILTEHQRKKIDRNITKFVENMEKFKSRELPLSRGILVVGPPGTGKTLLCNTIMSQTECTFIYITSESVSNRGDISDMYDLARSLFGSLFKVYKKHKNARKVRNPRTGETFMKAARDELGCKVMRDGKFLIQD